MNLLLDYKNWSGLWTALVTPLTEDLTIDQKSLKNLIDYQIQEGVRGLVLAGSTGEGSLLKPEVYQELLESAKKFSEGRIPLVAGLGIGGTRSCLENLKIAKAAGMEGVLASAPAYIKCPEKNLREHFLELADQGLALCLYEIPSRTGMSFSKNFLNDLLRCREASVKNIVAFKDASCDFERLSYWCSEHSNQISFLSGDDESLPHFLNLGGCGVISVASHFFPGKFKEICERKTSDFSFNELWISFIQALFEVSNPVPAKSLLKRLGFIEQGSFEKPLNELNEIEVNELHRKFCALKEAEEEWGRG